MSTDAFSPFQVDAQDLSPGALRPVGTDLAFDFETGELFSSQGDIGIVRGTRTVAQWVIGSLLTERGYVGYYPLDYGSNIKSRIGAMLNEEDLEVLIRDAVRGHDRIQGVGEVEIDRSSNPEVVTVSFVVYLDWGERIVFRKVNLG